MAIGAYDIPLGAVTLSGNSIDFKPESFPLTWNPTTQTLSGRLPADAAPIWAGLERAKDGTLFVANEQGELQGLLRQAVPVSMSLLLRD